jgi:lipid II:glycine glycyltransferase (peptidoglycan interpeptide bridge formation enzyme)
MKSRFGWQPIYIVWKQDGTYLVLTENELSQTGNRSITPIDIDDISAAALTLQRTIPVRGFAKRMSVLYVPKGPLLDWSDNHLRNRVLTDMQTIARQRGAIFIKIDPDVRMGKGIPGSSEDEPDPAGSSVSNHLQTNGWLFSDEQVQFRNTCILDLTHSEADILAGMKQKTRYNIRLAERKGVRVRHGDLSDIPLLYQMYTETSMRDDFIIREENYYRTALQTFMTNPVLQGLDQPGVQPLIAEVDGSPIAAVIIFLFAGKAWYFYGMSKDAHREKMPNYLLQWEAIHLAKGLGCQIYDLWGAPDQFDETDSMWGVYRFKEGLGGRVIRHIGAWDFPAQPFFYRFYVHTLPRFLKIMRKQQKNQSRRMVG